MPKPVKKKGAETIRFGVDPLGEGKRLRRFGSLVIVQGADADIGRHVVCDRPITIGRDPEAELPLRDGSTSRIHCIVEMLPTGVYVVRDLGALNGTIVGGVRVQGPVSLTEGDKIFLGASVVKFTYVDELDQEFLAKVDEMVSTDALTGLSSRRKFDVTFEHAVDAAREGGTPLSVLVIDMDGLKAINDQHGHDLGGFAIVEVAQVLRERLAAHGEICRYGGDEFVAVLAGVDKPAALALAEAVRDAVTRRDMVKDGVVVRPTLSIGVAALPDDGDSPRALFRAADAALYRAKGAGKNQVVPA